MMQTGDKSGEVTARMNLSDLRLVVGLKSNSNIHHIFRNSNTNNTAIPGTQPAYFNLPGKQYSSELSALPIHSFLHI